MACHFGMGLLDPGARQHVLECECKSVNDVYQRYTLYMNMKALSGFQSSSACDNGHFYGGATVGHPERLVEDDRDLIEHYDIPDPVSLRLPLIQDEEAEVLGEVVAYVYFSLSLAFLM